MPNDAESYQWYFQKYLGALSLTSNAATSSPPNHLEEPSPRGLLMSEPHITLRHLSPPSRAPVRHPQGARSIGESLNTESIKLRSGKNLKWKRVSKKKTARFSLPHAMRAAIKTQLHAGPSPSQSLLIRKNPSHLPF